MKIYGIIGYPLAKSFSPTYFNSKFKEWGRNDLIYKTFPIENIISLKTILTQEKDLCGFNITSPHKENIIPFLFHKNEVVENIGACNCVKIIDGNLYGFNTDVIGFEISLKKIITPTHNKALILGTGGAAKASAYVMKKNNIPFKYVSRKHSTNTFTYSDLNKNILTEYPLIINATPLGMYNNIETFPPIPYELLNDKNLCYDLIYNPSKTRFLELAERQGSTIKNGWDMLILQAEESWKIWEN